MPCCRCSIRMSSEDCISPEKLKDELLTGDSLLVLDCRSQAEFTRCHVKGAINVTLPSLMLRRLKAGKLNVACIFQNNEAKDKFQSLSKTRLIVLYDDSDASPQGNPSSVVALLYKKLKQEGCRPSFLEGGYPSFKEQYSEFCVSQEPSSGNTDEILGLCNLKISEDSAYGTSDSDNDNQFSPSSNFPVEVMPYLYLGNAKNSADLNQLKKCGITYILNVTPNVPNMFENDKNFKYMKIPINDHLSQNLLKFFPDAITFIDEAREESQGVLVHCLAGISRSVTITVAYLMQKQNMTLNEAYDFVKKCKPNISPNFNFMGQLVEFEKTLGNRNRKCSCTPADKCFQHTPSNSLSISFPDSDDKGQDTAPT